MKIKFGDSTHDLTVGSFADETHRVSFFIEDDAQDFVFECTADFPIEELEIDQVVLKPQIYFLFLKEGLVNKERTVDGGLVICNLTQKALDFLKEYEAQI